MAKSKFYIIAERYMPRSGVCLFGVSVSTKRVYDYHISSRFEDGGFKKTLRFSLNGGNDGIHYCTSLDKDLMGLGAVLYRYSGFDNVEDAKKYLDMHWAGKIGYEEAVAKLNKE